jgi:hypothetical protein
MTTAATRVVGRAAERCAEQRGWERQAQLAECRTLNKSNWECVEMIDGQ